MNLKEQLDYYEKQYSKAAKDYVKSGKMADRLVAIKYQGKVEALTDANKSTTL